MLSDDKQPVRRTVIVTSGPLSQVAGQYLADLMVCRGGPAAAVVVVDADAAGAEDEGFLASLQQALTRISPPNLGSVLAESGWRLVYPRDLQVFLVADTTTDGDKRIRVLSQWVIDAAYRYLGLECLPTLIWLASGPPAETISCLAGTVAPPFTQNIVALSVLNEEGLLLPEASGLSLLTGELLWCLVATPLQAQFAEWAASTDTLAGGATPITTVGLTAWSWSPKAVEAAFIRQWLQDVLALWLAGPAVDPPSEGLHVWLQEQALDRAGLWARLSADIDQACPAYAHLARTYPWPWQMHAHVQALKQAYEADVATIAGQKQAAALCQAEILPQASETLRRELAAMMDTRPIGGSATAVAWLWALARTWDDLYEQLLDEAATYDGLDADLAEERGEVEAQLRERLESWPGGAWRFWARVWRWPALGWRYWQLRQLGLRLAALLGQQSVRQRQRAGQTAVGQTLAELGHLARQWHRQAGEIGEMLASWQGAIGGDDAATVDSLSGICRELALPVSLYARLVSDLPQEAALAAEAVSGLGRQIERLDAGLLADLRQVAAARLAGVWQITAVHVLAAAHETPAQWGLWRRAAWEAASPLWRYDEGCLPETSRRPRDAWTCFIGAGVSELPALWAQGDGATAEFAQASWLESGDRRRLFLLRLRRGLTPEAMVMSK
ncbi:MAG: hypothetical protein KA773_10105 [Chloroflexi bacterium]|nr:hypothetical protein [Chloroflexota bacterium]